MLKRILLSLIAIPVFYGLMFAITSIISAEVVMNGFGESQAPEEAQQLAANASLVGWWKFENDAEDSSTYDNNGTPYGVTYSHDDGVQANYAVFDGVTSYVSIADDESLDFTDTGKFTVEAWINAEDYQENYYDLVVFQGYNKWAFGVFHGNKLMFGENQWNGYFTKQIYSNEVDLQPGEWYHIAVVYDVTEKTATFYLNGDFVGSRQSEAKEGIEYTGNLTIGYPHTVSFNGSIDEVKIWNKALSAEEIETAADDVSKEERAGYTWEYKEEGRHNEGIEDGYQYGSNGEVAPVQQQTGDDGDEVVIESGDKVRGDEGQGDVNQVQNVECQAWDEWCVDPVETPESADVVLESGDKVRGDEGQGSTVQNCDSPDYIGTCPYGDYDPTTVESTANGNPAK